jgi:hypothetical protein
MSNKYLPAFEGCNGSHARILRAQPFKIVHYLFDIRTVGSQQTPETLSKLGALNDKQQSLQDKERNPTKSRREVRDACVPADRRVDSERLLERRFATNIVDDCRANDAQTITSVEVF